MLPPGPAPPLDLDPPYLFPDYASTVLRSPGEGAGGAAGVWVARVLARHTEGLG